MSFDGVVAEPLVSWDFDSTNWRSVCRAQHTLQQDSHGCGVACLAMVAGVPYAEVRALCVDLGLGEKRGRKHPFATNFRDLTAVATQMGLNATMRRWNGWYALNGIGIIKVPTKAANWHWMVAERTQAFGVVVQDPELDWPAFERAPLDVMYRSPATLRPSGNWVAFQ